MAVPGYAYPISPKMAHRGLKTSDVYAENRPHGDRLKYKGGCRCVPCRAANSRYESNRLRERAAGRSNGIISAKRAQRHIKSLNKSGLGKRAISKASKVRAETISNIKTGKKPFIREATERAIMAVDKYQVLDKTLIDAGPTWRLIDILLGEGFTKRELAKRLGYAQTLQFKRGKITAGNARKVKTFYNQIMIGG